MKKYLILLCIVSLSSSLFAQNSEMAKAFYKKALQSYEDKNYKDALILIEKTKENLGGNTNPDITYIEAKSRFENEININKAKKLFNQFLNEANSNDNRRNEVTKILVDIETSGDYYDNGNKHFYKYSKNDINYILEFSNSGNKIKRVSENDIVYYFDNARILAINKNPCLVVFYRNGNEYSRLFYSSFNDFKNNEFATDFFISSNLAEDVFPKASLNKRFDNLSYYSYDNFPLEIENKIKVDFPNITIGYLNKIRASFYTSNYEFFEYQIDNKGKVIYNMYGSKRRLRLNKIKYSFELNSEKNGWIKK